mmetsp:Transcript_36736/g.41804  ORF Transcript_36736/g.41804 Transcript_36736/m.41804 type:complete len:91 (-) Transcript_36736:85-357(-)
MRLLRLITLIVLAVFPAVVFNQCLGTICPYGCCPAIGYVCCEDLYCAFNPEDCPEYHSFGKSARKNKKYVELSGTKGDDKEDASFLSENP